MTVIQALEFEIKIDRFLKKNNSDFEAMLSQFEDFPTFLHTSIGKIWLNKPYGIKYINWQES